MNPVAKWLGITVAVILLLISGATLLVSRLIDEAELKLRLLEMVNSSLDGTLEINGELSLSLWPRLSLALGDVHLRTPAGASEDFASASELRLGVNLMPLLRRQVSVDELLIKGFTLNARRDRNGNANWEALGTKPSGSTGPAAGTIASAAVAAPLLLAIDRVRIADGTLIFSDERTGAHHELRELDITSDDVNMTGDPFRLEGSARLLGDNGKHDIGIALGAQVDADLDTGLVRLANSRLTLRPAAGPSIELAAPGISASLDMVPYCFIENDRVQANPTETMKLEMNAAGGRKSFTREGPGSPGFRGEDVLPTLTQQATKLIKEKSAALKKASKKKKIYNMSGVTGEGVQEVLLAMLAVIQAKKEEVVNG